MRRLRGSHLTSTLIPDTDNAVVGSHCEIFSQVSLYGTCFFIHDFMAIKEEESVYLGKGSGPLVHHFDLQGKYAEEEV